MGYRLEKDEQLGAGFRRILIEQTERLSEALASADANLEEAIHEVRKRCKRVRAVARCIEGKMRLSETLLDGYRHSAMLMSK